MKNKEHKREENMKWNMWKFSKRRRRESSKNEKGNQIK